MAAGWPDARLLYARAVGEKGLFHYARVRQALQARRGLHPFTWPELDGYLSEAGFTDFAPQAFGSLTFFQARKR